MANRTWLEKTNDVLDLSGLRRIASAAIFNNDDELTEYQHYAKYFVRIFNKMLGVRAFNHYNNRRIPLNIDSSSAVWPIDTGVDPQSIQFESFRNVTQGASTYGPLTNWKYQEFLDRHPDVSLIQSGPPTHWVLLPIERQESSPVWKIRIYPNPDRQFTLEFIAKLNAPPLENATSLVLFPPHYDHVLEYFSWGELERALGEGKEGLIYQFAEKASRDVKLAGASPADQRRAVRTMKMASRRGIRPNLYGNNWTS